MTIKTLGIDIAKTVFQFHGVNCNGRVALANKMARIVWALMTKKATHQNLETAAA